MEFELNGHAYVVGPMDVFTQLQIARKFVATSTVIGTLMDEKNKDKDTTLLVTVLLSYFSDEDSDFVVRKCLSVVSRRDGDKYAKVMSAGGLMYSDIGLSEMLGITKAVVVGVLGDFFGTALANLEGAAEN